MKQSIAFIVNETANMSGVEPTCFSSSAVACGVLLDGAAMKVRAVRADPGVGTASVRLMAADSEC